MIAETMEGRGDEAFAYWLKISPSYREAISDLHRTEPYVYSQMIAGPAAHRTGEAKNSWLTGTAAWNWVAITQYILGIRPQLDCLLIDPCIPSDWSHYTVDRRFRGARYTISVQNPRGVFRGIHSMSLNGEYCASPRIPLQPEGSENTVEVTLG
jgi:cellobiose phosphorylase